MGKDQEKVGHGVLLARIREGNPHAVLTIGLFELTLVPLARVAFCFILFIKERDYTYVAFTAYVLAGLIVGVLVRMIFRFQNVVVRLVASATGSPSSPAETG